MFSLVVHHSQLLTMTSLFAELQDTIEPWVLEIRLALISVRQR
jgi:hypothetical protein